MRFGYYKGVVDYHGQKHGGLSREFIIHQRDFEVLESRMIKRISFKDWCDGAAY